ncbi:response regulator [Geobacter sp. SVR]|uniref:response regulator n=1 Tax=Geobacter sp. SVR TaxID=2495594 RepID=UPI00143F036C|nr:response regulator [Geobacter sp. SVR]BCS52772.1 hypothetical protein GSVR_10800 [Geobacter sp. SVR]GCF86638.1 hypothetical protein GSbR_32380 [Geobacter sp. SVR]
MSVRVVIFEDDVLTLEMLRKCLTARGYEVTGYTDPQMCRLNGDPVCRCPRELSCGDILITDNYMPHMTGLELIRQQSLRGCKAVRHRAVISGNLSPSDREAARELGCKVFPKPVVLQELFAWLRECQDNL